MTKWVQHNIPVKVRVQHTGNGRVQAVACLGDRERSKFCAGSTYPYTIKEVRAAIGDALGKLGQKVSKARR